MDRSFEFLRCRLKVFATGSLDRMGLSPSVRSAKIGHQQQPFSDPARLAFSEFSLPHSIIVPKQTAGRLAGTLWPSGCAARDLCGPETVCRNHLQSSQLDICGRHQGLSSHPQRLQQHGPVTENGFCQTVKVQCTNTVIPAYPQTCLSYRRSKNHAQRTTNANFARVF